MQIRVVVEIPSRMSDTDAVVRGTSILEEIQEMIVRHHGVIKEFEVSQ